MMLECRPPTGGQENFLQAQWVIYSWNGQAGLKCTWVWNM
jgi:hypothetical protein